MRAQPILRAAAPLFLVILCGCGNCIPVPRSRNIAKAGSVTAPRPKLYGFQSREDLERTLGLFKTDASADDFFWARWEQAMLPWVWEGGFPATREWSIRNVLARFDSSGRVTACRNCSERELIDCLSRFAAPATLAEPLSFKANRWARTIYHDDPFHGAIEFTPVGACLKGHAGSVFRPGAPIEAAVPWTGIQRLRVRYGSSAQKLSLTVDFRPRARGIDGVSFAATPLQTRHLVAALAASNPKAITRN